jgi:3-isopropylmalate/(R)-2-methylmalate dehydratase small subunit
MTTARQAVQAVSSYGVAVRGADIDTDRIIPARFMKCVTFDGLGQYAFYDARYNEQDQPTNHPFNDPRFAHHGILVVNRNFGCGSSREHAPQALQKWGIRALIGESFAEIFAGNCTVLGMPAVTLPPAAVQEIQDQVERQPNTEITIDLVKDQVRMNNEVFICRMPPAYRKSLIQGTWDSTGILLENLGRIRSIAHRLPYLHGY